MLTTILVGLLTSALVAHVHRRGHTRISGDITGSNDTDSRARKSYYVDSKRHEIPLDFKVAATYVGNSSSTLFV